MRAVSRVEEIDEAYKRCQSEARASFGNGDVYVEQLMPRARHIEVQIIGDRAGNVSHLWERECSIQRRNQKIVEIAPSPGLAPAMRDRLTAAAVRMAKEVRYDNLGTFEFLVNSEASASDEAGFAFIEANPRLQVEHTVTEEVTGIDLVKLQIQLASGSTLAELGMLAGGHSEAARVRDAGANQHGIDARGRQRETGGRDDHRVRGAVGTAGADRFVRLRRIHDQPEFRFAARQADRALAFGGLRRRGDEDLSRAVANSESRACRPTLDFCRACCSIPSSSRIGCTRASSRTISRRWLSSAESASAAVLRSSDIGSQSGRREVRRTSRGREDRRERSAGGAPSRQIGERRAVANRGDHNRRDTAGARHHGAGKHGGDRGADARHDRFRRCERRRSGASRAATVRDGSDENGARHRGRQERNRAADHGCQGRRDLRRTSAGFYRGGRRRNDA